MTVTDRSGMVHFVPASLVEMLLGLTRDAAFDADAARCTPAGAWALYMCAVWKGTGRPLPPSFPFVGVNPWQAGIETFFNALKPRLSKGLVIVVNDDFGAQELHVEAPLVALVL